MRFPCSGHGPPGRTAADRLHRRARCRAWRGALREWLAEQFGPEWTGRLKELSAGAGQMALGRPVARRSFAQGARADRAKGLAMSTAHNVTVIDTRRGIAPRPTAVTLRSAGAGASGGAAGKGRRPRRPWHSGTGADRRVRRQDRGGVVVRRGVGGAAASGGADRSQHADPVPQHRQAVRRDLALSRPAAGRAGPGRCAQPGAQPGRPRRSTIPKARCGRATPTPAAISARPCRWPRRWRRSRPRSPAASASRPASAPACSRWNISTAASASIRCGNGAWPSWKPICRAHKLPRHPLVEDGYPSIGCMPCTRRVQAGEDYRAGRWSGIEKDECGIHLTDGGGI